MINKSKDTENFKNQIKNLNLNAYTNRCYYFLYQKIIYICQHSKLKIMSVKYNRSLQEIGSHEKNIELVLIYMNEEKFATSEVQAFKSIERLKDFRKKADYTSDDINSIDIKKVDKMVDKINIELEKIIKKLYN